MNTFSKKQQEFLDAVLSGSNIFLTGKAGTGKSFAVKEAIRLLKENKKKVIAIAPTGLAANQIGGQTVHSMFAIRPFGILGFEDCNYLRTEKRRILDAIDVIFIDEVSMLRPDILDAMNWTMIKNGCQALVHKQIVFVGDMKQLPVVLDDNERSVLYKAGYKGDIFMDAEVYSKLNVKEIELDEVLRQNDKEFIDSLNIVRDGGKDPYFKQFVSLDPKGIVLAPHNSTVARYNKEGLDAIDSPLITFEATVEGKVNAEDFNVESIINVKDGAKIMYLINSSKENNLFNGTIGVFVVKDDKYFIRVGANDYELMEMEFSKKEYVLDRDTDSLVLKTIGTIKQYPIRLAYALSIHKSQGLTFEEVTVDLTLPCFQKGQMYVALSRVTTPKGLRIICK